MATLEKHDLLGMGVLEGKVVIQSFSEASLKEVHTLDPSISLIQLISYKSTPNITKKA